MLIVTARMLYQRMLAIVLAKKLAAVNVSLAIFFEKLLCLIFGRKLEIRPH